MMNEQHFGSYQVDHEALVANNMLGDLCNLNDLFFESNLFSIGENSNYATESGRGESLFMPN